MKKQKIKDGGQGSGSNADSVLYRMSSGGQSLQEVLKKFIDDGKITHDLAKKVLTQFEKVWREGGCSKAFRHCVLN